jgi:hypothetical protein
VPPLLIFLVLGSGLWLNESAHGIPLTLAIFLIGAGGGVISTYFRLKEVSPSMVATNAILQIYVTPLIAGMLGWICYAFFLTGMLQGPLFPQFTGQDTSYVDLDSVLAIKPASVLDAAKALLWAFVAGFSEKLIPNILDKLARTLEDETDSGLARAEGGAPGPRAAPAVRATLEVAVPSPPAASPPAPAPQLPPPPSSPP